MGSWGGSCTCPDGQIYEVGDVGEQGDGCGKLACYGGEPGVCSKCALTLPEDVQPHPSSGNTHLDFTCLQVRRAMGWPQGRVRAVPVNNSEAKPCTNFRADHKREAMPSGPGAHIRTHCGADQGTIVCPQHDFPVQYYTPAFGPSAAGVRRPERKRVREGRTRHRWLGRLVHLPRRAGVSGGRP